MKDLFDSAYRLVHTGERCVLAMIRKSSGSTPRGQGAGMLVLEDGSVRCTIGGGFLEWSAVETARNVLKNGSGIVERFELRGVDATVSDAICGGDAEVCYCLLDRRSLPVLERLYSARRDRIPGEFFLVQKGEDVILCCRVSGKTVLPQGVEESIAGRLDEDDPQQLFHGLLPVTPRVILMGAGHVAEATAKVARTAGFDCVVVDDREEYACPQRFPGAECIVCDAYDELLPEKVSAQDFIVIVTRGHRNDRESLAWALTTKAGYVGMIGSRTKRDLIYRSLEEQGVSREKLAWVHSPIGLPIGGRTPGMIAVSIVAELIQVYTAQCAE